MTAPLKRKVTENIADLASDQDPILLSPHGKPAAYLMAVDAFEALTRRLDVLEGIFRSERAIENGRLVSHEEAKKRLGRWLD